MVFSLGFSLIAISECCTVDTCMTVVGEELPWVYKNYRLVPTLLSDDEMWPLSAVQQQLVELQVNRGVEDVREWQDNQSEDERSVDNTS